MGITGDMTCVEYLELLLGLGIFGTIMPHYYLLLMDICAKNNLLEE